MKPKKRSTTAKKGRGFTFSQQNFKAPDGRSSIDQPPKPERSTERTRKHDRKLLKQSSTDFTTLREEAERGWANSARKSANARRRKPAVK